ncbi:hypothetical protein pdam_00019753 [Pocillopora damicornis]|uniref:Uncharacterized protein n=1 Tax=Pocillopora damicornis TaxID=46731 RepID=A0A3M6TRB5_POCDA|nr:hypothetical protein pdam_00019753 [Pocillopora damicornis]
MERLRNMSTKVMFVCERVRSAKPKSSKLYCSVTEARIIPDLSGGGGNIYAFNKVCGVAEVRGVSEVVFGETFIPSCLKKAEGEHPANENSNNILTSNYESEETCIDIN